MGRWETIWRKLVLSHCTKVYSSFTNAIIAVFNKEKIHGVWNQVDFSYHLELYDINKWFLKNAEISLKTFRNIKNTFSFVKHNFTLLVSYIIFGLLSACWFQIRPQKICNSEMFFPPLVTVLCCLVINARHHGIIMIKELIVIVCSQLCLAC